MTQVTEKFAIFGTGGFAKETLWAFTEQLKSTNKFSSSEIFFVENDENYKPEPVLNYKVIKQSEFDPNQAQAVIAIGSPQIREKVVRELPQTTQYFTVTHPGAHISPWCKIGEGAIITAGVIVTCNIEIGRHSHLNLNSTIGHDCKIGDFFTTAPGAHISGDCKISDRVYFGTNAAVRQGISISSDVTIGMGTNVVKDISRPGVYIGSPAKKLDKDK